MVTLAFAQMAYYFFHDTRIAGGSDGIYVNTRPDALVPADGPLTAGDLRRVRFSTAVRGYRMSEVDALLDRLAAELEPRVGPEPPAGRDAADPPGDEG